MCHFICTNLQHNHKHTHAVFINAQMCKLSFSWSVCVIITWQIILAPHRFWWAKYSQTMSLPVEPVITFSANKCDYVAVTHLHEKAKQQIYPNFLTLYSSDKKSMYLYVNNAVSHVITLNQSRSLLKQADLQSEVRTAIYRCEARLRSALIRGVSCSENSTSLINTTLLFASICRDVCLRVYWSDSQCLCVSRSTLKHH